MAEAREEQLENIGMHVDDKPNQPDSDTVDNKITCDEPCISAEPNKQNEIESKADEPKEQQTQNTEDVTLIDGDKSTSGDQPDEQVVNETMHIDNEPIQAASSSDAAEQVTVDEKIICDEPSTSDESNKLNIGEEKVNEQKEAQSQPNESVTQIDGSLANGGTQTAEINNDTSKVPETVPNTDSLKMLCQYGSDSEEDEEACGVDSTANPEDQASAKSLLDTVLKSTDAYRLVTSEE